jgi:hypothetical protein
MKSTQLVVSGNSLGTHCLVRYEIIYGSKIIQVVIIAKLRGSLTNSADETQGWGKSTAVWTQPCPPPALRYHHHFTLALSLCPGGHKALPPL